MKPLVTIIREALRDRLLESAVLSELTGGRVQLNRFEPWDEGELTLIGVYVVSEEPVNTADLNPAPDERKLTFTVEIVSRQDEALEERLDLIALLVEVLYTLPALGRLLAAGGVPDSLLKIDWLGNERGYAPEAENTLGVNIMTFSLEYRVPWPEMDLPDFEEAWTTYKATGTEKTRVKVEGQVNLKGG